MEFNSNQIASIFIGSMILGVWMMLALFEPGLGTEWGIWGLVGLLMAAALYGMRLADTRFMVLLWVVIGLSVGALLTGVFTFQEPRILAALVTLTGGGLVVLGIPVARQPAWIMDEEPTEAQA